MAGNREQQQAGGNGSDKYYGSFESIRIDPVRLESPSHASAAPPGGQAAGPGSYGSTMSPSVSSAVAALRSSLRASSANVVRPAYTRPVSSSSSSSSSLSVARSSKPKTMESWEERLWSLEEARRVRLERAKAQTDRSNNSSKPDTSSSSATSSATSSAASAAADGSSYPYQRRTESWSARRARLVEEADAKAQAKADAKAKAKSKAKASKATAASATTTGKYRSNGLGSSSLGSSSLGNGSSGLVGSSSGGVLAKEKQITYTQVGVADHANPKWRRSMEDSHVAIRALGGDESLAFFGVYDGHGGRGAVDYIEKTLHKNVIRELKRSRSDSDEAITRAIHNAYLSTDATMVGNITDDSGSTVVTALIRVTPEGERKLYVSNAGDARAVLCQESLTGYGILARRLSYDHKSSDRAEAERVRRSGGFVSQSRGDVARVNGTLAIARALGDHSMKRQVIPDPYQTATSLRADAAFVIVACDGLWDVMEDDQAVRLVYGMDSAQDMAQLLTDEAIKRGTTDNVTVCVVLLK